jgi:hypothetical protein
VACWPAIPAEEVPPLERSSPDLRGDGLHRQADREDSGRPARSLTAATAFDTARRVAAGEVKPGFQTPSLAFGADYILDFEGATREDLNT